MELSPLDTEPIEDHAAHDPVERTAGGMVNEARKLNNKLAAQRSRMKRKNEEDALSAENAALKRERDELLRIISELKSRPLPGAVCAEITTGDITEPAQSPERMPPPKKRGRTGL